MSEVFVLTIAPAGSPGYRELLGVYSDLEAATSQVPGQPRWRDLPGGAAWSAPFGGRVLEVRAVSQDEPVQVVGGVWGNGCRSS